MVCLSGPKVSCFWLGTKGLGFGPAIHGRQLRPINGGQRVKEGSSTIALLSPSRHAECPSSSKDGPEATPTIVMKRGSGLRLCRVPGGGGTRGGLAGRAGIHCSSLGMLGCESAGNAPRKHLPFAAGCSFQTPAVWWFFPVKEHPPPPLLVQARPCLSTGWALNRCF